MENAKEKKKGLFKKEANSCNKYKLKVNKTLLVLSSVCCYIQSYVR